MTPKILIDLDVFTKAVWDKKKEANEFLERVEKEFDLITPVAILFHIVRNWKYKKLADKIFRKIDKLTAFYVGISQTNHKSIKLIDLPLRIFAKRLSRFVGISVEDAMVVAYTAIHDIDFLATYNRRHLKSNEQNIMKFLEKYDLDMPEIIVPEN